MLLTLTTTHRPATDRGFLLVKHPDRVHRFDLPYGTATVMFPEATERRCTAALLLEADPQRLDHNRDGGGGEQLNRYVNAHHPWPDYTEPSRLAKLRRLGRKRSLALREHALGLAALDAVAAGRAFHELVFGILACESEPVDPRL